jgi:peroxiredoxin
MLVAMRHPVLVVFSFALCLGALPSLASAPPVGPSEPATEGFVAPGWLGMRLEPASEAEQRDIGVSRAVPKVGRVFNASPALAAGVKLGDFVLTFQGEDVADVKDLVTRVGSTPAGTAIALVVIRGTSRVELSATLAARPSPQQLLQGDWLGKALPSSSLAIANGDGRYDLSPKGVEGKVVLIEYFATWCGPCRQLAVNLHGLLEREKANGFEVVSVSAEELDTVKAFADKTKPAYPLLVDDQHTFEQAFEPSVMPTVWVVDREGRVRGVWAGSNEYPAMEKLVLQLLGTKGAVTPTP